MSTGRVKQLAFSEGVTVGTPSEVASQAVGFVAYASEAAFEAAEGAAQAGDAFYDTTAQAVKYYNGSSWSVIGAGGAGEKNYIENASTATGWANVGDLDVATTTTASDLPREYTTGSGIKITADANTQSTADYVYYDFTLDDVDLNKKLKIQWAQKTTGTYSAGDLAVIITTQADRTTAVATPITTAIPAADGTFSTSFDSGDTATLSLVVRATTDMATDGGVVISDVVVGPGIQPQGAVVGEWQSYTPTINSNNGDGSPGTNTTVAEWRRVGDSMDIHFQYLQTAAGTTGTGSYYRVTIPSGFTIDSSKITTGVFTGNQTVGSAIGYTADTTVDYVGNAVALSSTHIGIQLLGESGAAIGAWGPSLVPLGNTSVRMGFTAKIPIAEWAGSGTLNVAQNDVEYAWNSDTSDADNTSSFGYGPSGVAFGSFTTAARAKRVRFQTPIQATDIVVLEVDVAGNGRWQPAAQRMPYIAQSTNSYGVSLNTTVGSTDVDVQFREGGVSPSNATYAGAGAAWSTLSTWKWRLKKSAGGQAVGFGLASTTSAGLVNPYTAGSGVVYSGTYTPTLAATANCSALTVENAQYSRVGGVVTVTARGGITVTTTATDTSFTLTLPVATSNFADAFQAIGVGVLNRGSTNIRDAAFVYSNSGAQTVTMTIEATTAGSGNGCTWFASFSYEIQ